MSTAPSGAKTFWDDLFSKKIAYSHVEFPDANDPVLCRAAEHFGDVTGKTLIDVGCGRAATSLFFAQRGANVISIDFSKVAIQNLTEFCQENQIENITAICGDAHSVIKDLKADLIFGSMILHHIEPFDQFALTIRNCLSEQGKGFFWENNARSTAMIWFRRNIVGKLWVPKYGDEEEFPLTVSEVNELRKQFSITIEYPELLMFRLASIYLLRGYFQWPFKMLDQCLYHVPAIRKYSYRQYVLLDPPASADKLN